MAYIDRVNSKHRTVTIIAVAMLEAAAIYGVIQGLDITFRRADPVPNPEGFNIPLDPPKPLPEPSPIASHSPVPRDPVLDAIKPVFDLPRPRDSVILDPQPIPSPSPTYVAIADIKPSPTPNFNSRPVKPRNNPASWATSNDYPSRDLREGNQGLTRFRLTVGTDGKVLGCEVTASSGFPGLDRAACDNIARRARFEPATGPGGETVTGTYSNTIRWVIPE